MTDQTGSLSTEVETTSTPADTSSVDNKDTSTTDNTPDESSGDEAPKRNILDIVNEKYDELAAKKTEQAAKDTSAAPGTRKVDTGAKAPVVETKEQPATTGKEVDPITGRELEPVKVPETTPAILREDWSKLPRNWQQYIAKRELETRKTIQQYGNDAKFAKEIYSYAKDMEPILKQGNIPLTTYTKDLFAMAYRISAGNPAQKAQVIAEIINTFRPDPNTLKALLGGQRPNIAPVKKQINIDEEVQKRIDAQKKQEQDQQTNSAIEAFYGDSKNEFARELDTKIGKAIEGGFVNLQDASGNARPIGDIMEDAYDFALRNSPEHQEVLKRRQTVQTSTPTGTTTQNPNAGKEPVRQAAPSPGGGRAVKQQQKRYGKRVEDAALDAWDVAAGRKG